MSALEKLKEEIRVEIGASDIFNVAVRQMAYAAACRAVDQCAAEIRAEVLREAAEKIRQHWYPRFPGKADYTQGMDAGYDRAADLIDPEVTP